MLPFFRAPQPVDADRALPGREVAVLEPAHFRHRVFGQPLDSFDEQVRSGQVEEAFFAMGCFWGAEKLFWNQPGVLMTAVGYLGGYTPNPNYRETCSGQTGHTETVRVVFDPKQTSFQELIRVFWENHDPTQGNRQGNDVGTQYRSALFPVNDEQTAQANASLADFQDQLTASGHGTITTTLEDPAPFYYAEDYHQQYLIANPGGYCPTHATGVTCG